MSIRIAVSGNCQAEELVTCLKRMLPEDQIVLIPNHAIRDGQIDVGAVASGADYVFCQAPPFRASRKLIEQADPDAVIVDFPALSFGGFHPDLIQLRNTVTNRPVLCPMGSNNSSIVLYAWMNGVSQETTLTLFRDEVYAAVGFYDHWEVSKRALLDSGRELDLDFGPELDRLIRTGGCFMHCTIHPRLPVMAALARILLDKIGVIPAVRYPENYLVDPMVANVVWPVYPEIGERLGLGGEYRFKPKERGGVDHAFTLEEFVAGSFEMYRDLDTAAIDAPRFQSPRFQQISRFFAPSASATSSLNPYRDLPDERFWRRSVAAKAAGDVDPVVKPRFQVSEADTVATAGSCFAQHIARKLAASGHHYLVAEQGDGLDPETRKAGNYGVYSARYGNLYTTRQLVQLFDRAYGRFAPADTAWTKADGVWIDPFRPEIQPDGFGSREALLADRETHFAAVRSLFETLDIFVFTLGLTEAWRARTDGAVFPLAPGVTGADIDPSAYEFVNFTAAEVEADLDAFVARLSEVNPAARIILTVSPVPLVATYEDRHVLVSTTASKSALRVAADASRRKHPHLDYFPSYEIITGAFNRGAYFEEDLRSIREVGVDHVMRVFMRHYSGKAGTAEPVSASGAEAAAIDASFAAEFLESRKIICEEERLDS